ncbi:WD40/YVTN/BNR-like repeat-containing protein [Leucobacter sp. M11]|uniref:WD40/YVTN/BNR-like repeat-containing protein n=1 Tax=Leucobacter sp. M11 TaxID=2993565 RepID=UPI002D80AA59|nr:hypothetical protein [Leucobacter sp. M11]MEB4614075.1 hypothetical protein [Leucobacter sp. M11]
MTRISRTGAARSRSVLPLAAALSASALLLSACAAAEPEAGPGPVDYAALQHVHALDTAPGGDAIIVATHQGVWEIPVPAAGEGPAETGERLGGQVFDVMGFAMSGDTLFASGHPAPGDRADLAVPNLGLIASEDFGGSWQDVSLTGEVDFHALDAAPLPGGEHRLVGFNGSSGLIVSDDSGASWSDGARGSAFDIAIDPEQTDTVYATGEQGLVRSQDGAVSFEPWHAELGIVLVETVAGAAFGLDQGGVLWRIDGAEPERLGKAGVSFEAFGAGAQPGGGDPAAEPRFVVSDEQGIRVSDDLGASWRQVLAKTA